MVASDSRGYPNAFTGGSEIELTRPERGVASTTRAHLATRAAAPTPAVEEHEIEASAVPEAGLLEVDLISHDGSTRSLSS